MNVGDYLQISIVGVVGMTFKCGSIIGSGIMQLPSSTTSNAAQISTEFNTVILAKPKEVPVIETYEVAEMDVADVNECYTKEDNCHRYAECKNADPGFSCECRVGYVEMDPESPGTRCKALCDINGTPYCMNGASCTNGTGFSDPSCNCTSKYYGARCQYEVNPTQKPLSTTFEAVTNATMNTTVLMNETTPMTTTPNTTTVANTTVEDNLNTTTFTELANTTYWNATEVLNTTTVFEFTTPFSMSCNVSQTVENYKFPPTKPGLISFSTESCPNATNVPQASVVCSEKDIFDADTLTISDCETIETILMQEFSERTMETLQFATANISTLTDEVVEDLSAYLQNISKLDIGFSTEEVNHAADIYSHLSEHYRESSTSVYDNSEEKQDLVMSLSTITRKLNMTHTTKFSTSTADINIEVEDVQFVNSSYIFEMNFFRDENASTRFTPMYLEIPVGSLELANDRFQPLRIVAVGFRSSVLFPTDRKTDWVISVSLGNATSSEEGINLPDPVVITSTAVEEGGEKQIDDFKKVAIRHECVFWDFEISEWSTEGCSAILGAQPATCVCDHLTNFAILVSRTELPADVALGVLTYVGCGLSIAGLILTVIIICSSKSLRKKYQMQILGNTCFSLALAMLLFVFGVDSQENSISCSILAAFMQYFFLATWFWTAVYSYTIYRDIIQVMRSYTQSFKLHIASSFAYGSPLVIVLLNAGITLGHVDRHITDDVLEESSYRARNFCWLRHFSLYFGFLVPVGMLLLLNIIIFSMVIPKVTCRRVQIQSSKAKRRVSQNIAMCVSLATTMGFSWVFGYLILISDNATFLTTMSWLFTIVNSMQGLLIFYFSMIRTGEIRRIYAPVSQLFSSSQGISTILPSSESRQRRRFSQSTSQNSSSIA